MTRLRIKELCKEKGTTLLSLSNGIGISQPSISQIANGKINPSLDTLEKIANYLGVGIEELFAPAGASVVCPHCGKLLTIKVCER